MSSAEVDEQPLPSTGKSVGIDIGITHFCVDSDGNYYFEHPKYYDRTLEKIKRFQKQLFRKQKGSKNREKVRIGLAKLYEELNQRGVYLC